MGDETATERHLKTLEEFKSVMYHLRDIRKNIVLEILSTEPKKKYMFNNVSTSLANILKSLENGLSSDYSRTFLFGEDGLNFNIKDEVLGCRKDMAYLDYLENRTDFTEFVQKLAESSHPCSAETFYDELKVVLPLMTKLCEHGLDIFITDWDGTMKNYCSTYETSMQPLYSAVLLALFAKKYTKFSAVLTAGPLRGPGILDLVCVPLTGYLAFGGSWGQEWYLNDDQHWVYDSFLSREEKEALKQLEDVLETELFEDENFIHFKTIGSGFQKKVDRVNIGFQNISNDVKETTVQKFMSAIENVVQKVDPCNRYFVIQKTHYDLEVVVRPQGGKSRTFDKADGVDQALKHNGVAMNKGTVLICGDTASDVPMVERALNSNPENTFTIFVNSNPGVKESISTLLKYDPDRYCFVGCTEVVHVAMACIVLGETIVF